METKQSSLSPSNLIFNVHHVSFNTYHPSTQYRCPFQRFFRLTTHLRHFGPYCKDGDAEGGDSSSFRGRGSSLCFRFCVRLKFGVLGFGVLGEAELDIFCKYLWCLPTMARAVCFVAGGDVQGSITFLQEVSSLKQELFHSVHRGCQLLLFRKKAAEEVVSVLKSTICEHFYKEVELNEL